MSGSDGGKDGGNVINSIDMLLGGLDCYQYDCYKRALGYIFEQELFDIRMRRVQVKIELMKNVADGDISEKRIHMQDTEIVMWWV